MSQSSTVQTIADLEAEGYFDGYARGAPSRLAATEDADVAARATCGRCGHVGLGYRAFHRVGSYLAFTVCPVCRDAREF